MRVYSRNVLLLTSHVFPTQTKTRHQSHAFCQLFLCNILFFSKLFKKTSNFFLFHFVPPSTDRLVYFIDFNHDTKREIDFFIWTTMYISIFCLLFPKNKNPHPGKFKLMRVCRLTKRLKFLRDNASLLTTLHPYNNIPSVFYIRCSTNCCCQFFQ